MHPGRAVVFLQKEGNFCSDSRTGQIKNPLHIVQRIFMTRTGIEPMLQP